MPLICSGTQLLRKSSVKADREVCDAFTAAVDAARKAQAEVEDGKELPKMLSEQPCQTVRGEDMSLLVVLQREMGAVAPSEYNPVTKCCVQSRICSIDSTTCLILGFRDPYTGTTVIGHVDQAGTQVEESLPSMLNYIPVKPITTAGLLSHQQRDEIEALATKYNAKRVLQLYMLGAVKFPRFSAETLAAVLRQLADDMDVVYDVVIEGTCVWSQNLQASGKALIHRGLMVDSKTGKATPVECDKLRSYPAGRLRMLRFFDATEKRLSAVTLLPGETISTASPVDLQGKRKALPFVVMVRPFKFPEFSSIVARKPLSTFAEMSTSPEMEPADFAETLKSSVVFASLTSPEKVFSAHPKNPRVPCPVAFQLTIGVVGDDAGAPSAAEAAAATEESAATGNENKNATGDAVPSTTAPKPTDPLGLEWVQISPPRAV
jgi:hypothetical protein